MVNSSHNTAEKAVNGSSREKSDDYIDIELFAGGGGMAIGLREAGFTPARFYEADDMCCETLKKNADSRTPTIVGTVVPGKAENASWAPFKNKVRLLAGGAPCQPFSLGGKHKAHRDGRNLFPEVLRAVRETRPMAVLLENVRGLARPSFRPYFDYIIRQLKFPSIACHENEKWRAHDARLKRVELAEEPEYHVDFRIFDAADFGVPQNRARLFIVATRVDIPTYVFPRRTHSREALERALREKEYWDRHGVRKPAANGAAPIGDGEANGTLPWITVRDALMDLPTPADSETEAEMNHWRIPGARSYEGHTGSRLDWPAKTIKAGVHGVPGGENTVTDAAGNFRYFTLRETARIQSFPDHHLFVGARVRVTRQVGNAVPSRLATAIATPLFTLISNELAERAARRKK